MGTKKNEKIILIDADVLSHFISGGQITLLHKIFPYPIKILDKVYAEISRMPGRKTEVDNLLNFKMIERIPFPEYNPEIRKEYHYIKKKLFKGDGESACLAVVRYSKDILASSNLKDTAHYCKLHQINYLTTMDFLCQAVKNGQLTEADCDDFIQRVLKAGSRLPVKKWGEYECREVMF
jgi:predicted nucleic acid-binding protein